MDKYEKWKLIEVELMAAYALLPKGIIESGDGYCEEDFLTYIEHNELLMAMEELDSVIVDNGIPPKQFWTHLIRAANIMGHGHAERYKSIRSAAT
ncbi:hypothetical protein MHO82_21220 [Vibrio sp. Of7-15]|uniref:hypothetical protein n=1 Tax=Vibrio sp. Of7-15 TaxID=2724879 RepID=UPI001EF3B31E|nr:hypothetical protein [Vibrio sp. Of7-15]